MEKVKVVLPEWLVEMLDDCDGDTFNGGYLGVLHELWRDTDEVEEDWINDNIYTILKALENGYEAEEVEYLSLIEATNEMMDGNYFVCEDSYQNDHNAITYSKGKYVNKVGDEVLLNAEEILSTKWRIIKW